MHAYRNTVSHLQRESHVVESDENRWLNSLEVARRLLTENMSACKSENSMLLKDSKRLETLCIEEIGIGSGTTRKKKSTFMRDLIAELNGRQDTIEGLLEQYEGLITDLSTKLPKDRVPTIDLVLDEFTGDTYVAPPPPQTVTLTTSAGDAPGSEGSMEVSEMTLEPPVAMDTVDDTDQVHDDANSSAMVSSAAPRRSMRNSDEVVPLDESDARNGAEDDVVVRETNLYKLFLLVDEKLRSSELSLAEADVMFPEEDEDWIFTNEYLPKSKSKSAVTTDPLKSKWTAYPDQEMEQKLTEPYFLLKKDTSWSKLLESLCTGSTPIEALASVSGTRLPQSVTKAIAQRRKKRSTSGSAPAAIPLKSFLAPRTPRGVPLIVSPLSQHPDRLLGSVFGAGSLTMPEEFSLPKAEGHSNAVPLYAAEGLPVPSSIVKSEDGIIQRCGLLSVTLSAENKLKRLASSAEETT